MNYTIDDYERILKEISEVTLTKYESDYYSCPVLLSALEDMLREYKKLKNEFEEYKINVKENYKQIDISKQCDLDDKDFI